MVIPALFMGVIILIQCTRDGDASKAGQKPDLEAIATSRTMGLTLLEENKLEAAAEEFKKLISLAPGEVLGYANLGLVYLRTGDYEEAKTIWQKRWR